MIKILFMGTPDIAQVMLKRLLKDGYDVIGVVTQPDKKAGRKLTPANRGMHSKCDFLESGISYSRFRLEINNI